MISLQDLATKLALNKSTVSRALRDDPLIAKETRERVLAMAKEMGYLRDPLVSTLAAHGWRRSREKGAHLNLAYLLSAQPPSKGRGSERFRGALERASELGYSCEPLNLADYPDVGRLAEVLYARGIRGILCGFSSSERLLQAPDFPWERFSIVGCGVNRSRLPIHSVSINGVASTELAVKRLREKGFRRIGLAHLHFGGLSEMDHQKAGAFLLMQRNWPRSERVPMWSGRIEERDRLVKWADRTKPDIILATVDAVYWMLAEKEQANGATCPFASLYTREESDPGLMGIAAGGSRIGRVAVDLLDAEIQRHERGFPKEPLRVMVEPEWLEASRDPD